MELLFGRLYNSEDYQVHKKEQIRNYRISYVKELHCEYPIVEMLCAAVNEAIPQKEIITGKRDARTRLMPNMLRGYFTDMGKVLKELYALQTMDLSLEYNFKKDNKEIRIHERFYSILKEFYLNVHIFLFRAL